MKLIKLYFISKIISSLAFAVQVICPKDEIKEQNYLVRCKALTFRETVTRLSDRLLKDENGREVF